MTWSASSSIPTQSAAGSPRYMAKADLDTLDYRVVRQDDEYGLLVDARGNSIGPNYVRFGLSLQDDFEGDSYYDLAARYVMSDITRTGGEWVSDAQIGQTSLLSTEVFLPLSHFSGWFVMPHAAVEDRNLPFFFGQEERGAISGRYLRLGARFRQAIRQLGRDPRRLLP